MNPGKRIRKRKSAIVIKGRLLRDILLRIKERIERELKHAGKQFN